MALRKSCPKCETINHCKKSRCVKCGYALSSKGKCKKVKMRKGEIRKPWKCMSYVRLYIGIERQERELVLSVATISRSSLKTNR